MAAGLWFASSRRSCGYLRAEVQLCGRTDSPPARTRCRAPPDSPPRPGSSRSDPAAPTWRYRNTDRRRVLQGSERVLQGSSAVSSPHTYTRVLTETGSQSGVFPVHGLLFCYRAETFSNFCVRGCCLSVSGPGGRSGKHLNFHRYL